MSARSLNWLKFGGLVALAFALGLLFAGLSTFPAAPPPRKRRSPRPSPRCRRRPSRPPSRCSELSEAFAAVAEHVRPSVVYIQLPAHRARRPAAPAGHGAVLPPLRPAAARSSRAAAPGSSSPPTGTSSPTTTWSRAPRPSRSGCSTAGSSPPRWSAPIPNTDVAVLKIDAKGLPPVALGNSDDARVGEWVLAIGNPLGEGLTFTVTSGIVSAKGRALNALPAARHGASGFHPDRRGHQPGQLRRPAGQRQGRGHRHQLGHRERDRASTRATALPSRSTSSRT